MTVLLCLRLLGWIGVLVAALVVFFYKQNTACDIRLSLVGSEMCVRDRGLLDGGFAFGAAADLEGGSKEGGFCPLYTSDAAAE